MKSSYNSTQVKSSLHLALLFLYQFNVFLYLFCIQFSLLFHVRTDTQSLLLNTNQTIANELVFTQNFHHHIVPLWLCVFAFWFVIQYINFGGYYNILYFCFYYVRPDCLLVLYRRKTELILSLIHFKNTTFSTCFIVARIYIVPKMRE